VRGDRVPALPDVPVFFARTPDCLHQGVPCFIPHPARGIYDDPPALSIYQQRYGLRLREETYCERVIRNLPAADASILSAGEGTGEFVLALATKYPRAHFYAFDYTAERVAIAQRLASHLRVTNVTFFVGSVADIPFPDSSFDAVIERGVFHILPKDVQVANLLEIERVCRGPVVMNWMANAYPYIARRACQALLLRKPQVWRDAIATYRSIEVDCRSLRRIAAFIQTVTGHHVQLLHTFRGDRELAHAVPLRWPCFQPLGGVTYATTD